MRLVRYGAIGAERPGLIDNNGTLRDLSAHMRDITVEQISPESLRRLTAIDPDTLPIVTSRPRFGIPLTGTRKFIAIGLNYADHALEAGLDPPPEPIFFCKAISCLSGRVDRLRPTGKSSWGS
jgi:2,4-diketo-3-deoxy-L-fuconate hydrolase